MTHKWTLLLATVILLLAGCSGAAQPTPTPALPSYADQLRGAVITPPRKIADFTIPSTEGTDFTLSDHRGEVILIYFGYRACPDFCPTTFAELKRVYAALNEPADKLKIVFVTIDPERDTLEFMTLYTHGFHKDFIGLRAEGEALEDLKDEFGVVAEKRQLGDSPLSYLMDHTASVFLVGKSGQLEAQYLYGTDYRDIVHDLQIILAA